MPLPIPNSGEAQGDFVSRCMSSGVMKNEFPEQKQRAAVCHSQFRKKKASTNAVYYQRNFITEEKAVDGKNKLYILGNAVESGISRNNVRYVSEELRAAAQTMIGVPLLLNHGDSDVRNIVGKVVDARFENGGIPFKAEVDTDEYTIVNKIKNGFINSVSIGADYADISVDDEGIKNPTGLEFLELSLVPIGGVKNATISQVIEEKYELKKMEDEKMETEELKKQIDELKKQNEQLEQEKEDLAKKDDEEDKPEPEKEAEESKNTKLVEELTKKFEGKIADLEKKVDENKAIVDAPAQEKSKPAFDLITENSEKKGCVDFYIKNLKQEDGKYIY